MEINTKVISGAENDFRLYRNQVERISDEVRVVTLKVSSLKGIDGIGSKLKRICGELDEASHILSQMSCFLEMAAETYNSSEERVADKRDSAYRKINVYYVADNPTVTPFPRYADLIPTEPTAKRYRIQETVIKKSLNSIRKKYMLKSWSDINNQVVKVCRLRNKTEILSVLSTIGRMF